MMRHRRILSVATASVFVSFGLVRAEVGNYTVQRCDGVTSLTSVSVQRGAGRAIFDAERLIPARVTHFKSSQRGTVIVPSGGQPPQRGKRVELPGLTLNAGVINPGGADRPLDRAPVLEGPDATPGLAVAFETPVVNLPGDDVVLFEIQRRQASPLAGDPVHVSPLKWRGGARSITIRKFDIALEHPGARTVDAFDLLQLPKPPQTVRDLQTESLSRLHAAKEFKALAVGIDLSALGYGEGEAVTGLFFQAVPSTRAFVDPVCIAGLPRPISPNILSKEPPVDVRAPGRLLAGFLDGPLRDVSEVVFAVRVPGNDHWYANFGYYSSPQREYPPQRAIDDEVKLPPIFKDGGRLCKFDLRTRAVTTLLDDPKGSVRDPQVHYDGGRILFSYRKAGLEYFHLYEINADGTGLRQITDGAFNDIEPAYLPDGGIVFCSDRCRRFVNCWITPVATLYRCEADGSGLRMLSSNIEHDNTPWVLDDGRVAYTRWEYVDRGQGSFHHLWTTNPDGTGQMVLFGNQHPGITMIDAKPIPGSEKIVASFSPGHGRPEHAGHVTIVDSRIGPDAKASARRISRGGPTYRDPYPITEDCFLVATGREIRVMDGRGNTEILYRLDDSDSRVICHEPRPLRPRPRERVIPPRVDLKKAIGRLVLADVYRGRNMEGVRRGEIKKLLVLEQLPKPVNFSGGMWPTSAGGTFTLARILGTVPVEADGSAYMEVPAFRSVFFVALDENDLSVKRMQSFLSVQPGETTGCVGCHEQRKTPPPINSMDLAAVRRGPSRIRAIEHVPDVPDFPRDIQPILDRHCVRCHSAERRDGGVDLCGDHTPLFCQSYWAMLQHSLISDGRNEGYGNRAPRTIGSSASRLMQLIDGSHHEAKVTRRESDTIRLWIEASAPYAGTYAALGSGLYPVEFPIEAMVERCGDCHQRKPAGRPIGEYPYFQFGGKGPPAPLVHEFLDLQQIRARIGYYKFGNTRPPQSLCNLTRPSKSLLLQAPLAKSAGGLGLCEPAVFADADDADYQAILAALRKAQAAHDALKRFDLPGFRPNDYYIYQMQRYGVLPKDIKPTDPVDGYETDRAYWKLFRYRPEDALTVRTGF